MAAECGLAATVVPGELGLGVREFVAVENPIDADVQLLRELVNRFILVPLPPGYRDGGPTGT
jgi:hypothetical protein